jgi:hypothetical protein
MFLGFHGGTNLYNLYKLVSSKDIVCCGSKQKGLTNKDNLGGY